MSLNTLSWISITKNCTGQKREQATWPTSFAIIALTDFHAWASSAWLPLWQSSAPKKLVFARCWELPWAIFCILLNKELGQLILLAFVIATPLAWWLMNNWLDKFAYHMTIGWQVVAVAGFILVLVALLTVSFHSIRTALSNPVDALRYEYRGEVQSQWPENSNLTFPCCFYSRLIS